MRSRSVFILAAVVGMSLSLFCVAESASAARVVVPCGTERTASVVTPRPMAFRLSNDGDCRYRIQLFDPTGERVLNFLMLPGESLDIDTSSVLVQTAIIEAALEPGVIGGVAAVRRLIDDVRVRVSAGSGGMPCDGTGRLIYQCDDELDCPIVKYTLRNVSTLCAIDWIVFRAGEVSNFGTMSPGEGQNVSGRITSLSIRVRERGPDTYAYEYERNSVD